MARLSPPLRWYGGKYYHAPKIVALIAKLPHTTYVEPYGGAASVLLAKPPSPVEVWNDLDGRLVNFFTVLRDKALREGLLEALAFTPYSRAEFAACCEGADIDDPVEAARRFFVLCQQATSSTGCQEKLTPGYWAKSVGVSRRGMAQNVSRWWGNISGLPAVADRLASVLYEHMDAMKLIPQYDTDDTLFYCDPTYVHGSRARGKGQVYKHEMTDRQHEELVDLVGSLKGMAIVSGYDNPVYRGRMAGWGRIEMNSKARSSVQATTRDKSGATPDRVEVLWLNPSAMAVVRGAES